jgi:hypothetical protein
LIRSSKGEAAVEEDAMAGYRCYILDAEYHIVQAHELDCETDAQAKETAGHLLAQDPYHQAAEVWSAARRVIKLERGALSNVLPDEPGALL